jgi:phage terminase large subunit
MSMVFSDEVQDISSLDEEEQRLYAKFLNGSHDKEYIKFEVEDPVDLAFILYDTIINNTHTLHHWQEEDLIFISKRNQWTKAEYLEYFLAACNGSGKDAYIVALLAIFFSLTIVRHRVVVSTASGNQLARQTRPYIEALANKANQVFTQLGYISETEGKVFIVKQNHIISPITGSEIVMFVTDDPGRAEGFHPWPDCPTQELCIILNECKSIPQEIVNAFKKCTYNRWVAVTSTGVSSGYFYSEFNKAVDIKTYHSLPEDQKKSCRKLKRRVTALDCPHISKQKIQQAIEEKGRESYHVKTTFFSEFANFSDFIFIERSVLDDCIAANIKPNLNLGIGKRAGFDVGAGGEGTSQIVILNNNTFESIHTYIEKDLTKTGTWALDILKRNNVPAENAFGDDNGVGQGSLDFMAHHGYDIRRVRNQFPAIDKATYGNMGAELYARAAEIIKKHLINLGPLAKDDELLEQLSTRNSERRGTFDRIYAQSKVDMRKDSLPSPDKADAFVLSLAGLTFEDFQNNQKLGHTNNIHTMIKFSTNGHIKKQSMENGTSKNGYIVYSNGVISMNRDSLVKPKKKPGNIFTLIHNLYGK